MHVLRSSMRKYPAPLLMCTLISVLACHILCEITYSLFGYRFTALVFVIDMLTDERRGATSRHLLDQYLAEHFKGVTTSEHFTVVLTAYFADYEKKKGSELINTLKALEYIFKFIIQSCIIAAQMNIQVGTTAKEQLLVFFQQVNGLLRNKDRQFVGAQTMAVKVSNYSFLFVSSIFIRYPPFRILEIGSSSTETGCCFYTSRTGSAGY